MTLPEQTPESQPALVLARFDSWVHVWFPDTRETRWINLAKTAFETVARA